MNCPAGKKVLGGGGTEISDFAISDSSPNIDGGGWTVYWDDVVDDFGAASATVYAVCAIVSS